jgi:phosphoglycerol transferase MdoB-like AlkP superfamily enzyme
MLVLAGVKAALLPFNVDTGGEFVRWVLRWGIVCADDLAFVALLTVACAGISLLAGRWKWTHRIWRPTMFLTFYASGVFAVFSYGFYQVMLQPFTIRLLTLVGDGGWALSSSIAPYLTTPMVTALILAPLAPLLLRAAGRWVPMRRDAPLGLRGAALATGLIVVYCGVAHAYRAARWPEPRRWENRIAINPHLELLTSCIEEFTDSDSWTVLGAGDYDMSDFVSRERPAGARPALNLPGWELAGPRPRNVIVFYLESVAAEYMSLYGNPEPTTPNLDRIVPEKGIMFDNFYIATPYSCKAIIAQMASVYPRLDWKLIVSNPERFDVPLISQVLKQHGFRTCLAHSGYFSWRGRDKFLRPRGCDMMLDAQNIPAEHTSSWGVGDVPMMQATLDWIDSDREKPFFALVYTIETHHPYATPAAPYDFKVKDPDLKNYLNGLRATDERIAWYMQELEKRGILDDTLIVILGDNGESFGQHNQRMHNFCVYQSNVHVPLVMIHPSLLNQKRHQTSPREQIDVSPTILDILGIPSPPVWQGRNLFRPDDGRPTYFFCVGNYVILGLRDRDWKYHYYLADGSEELFDLTTDQGENNNLAEKHADRCRDYRRRVAGWAKYQREFLRKHGSDATNTLMRAAN